jgi:hypothetical protein
VLPCTVANDDLWESALKTDRHEITIDIDDPIYVSELAEYLQLFGAFYDALRYDLYQVTKRYDDLSYDDPILAPFRTPFNQNNERGARWAQHALRYMGYPMLLHPQEALTIEKMHYECPLLLIAGGISIVLSAAVILSGGKIEMPGFKASLPPLGHGIEALRKALSRAYSPPPQLPRRSHPH